MPPLFSVDQLAHWRAMWPIRDVVISNTSTVSVDQLFTFWPPIGRRSFYNETPPFFLCISCSPIYWPIRDVHFTSQHLLCFCGSAVLPINCQLGGVVFTTQHLHFFCASAVRPFTGQSETYILPRNTSFVSVDQLFAHWLANQRHSFYHAAPPLFLWISCSPIDCQLGGVFLPCNTSILLWISCFAFWLPIGRRTFYHAMPPLFLWISCSPIDCPVRDVVFTRQHCHWSMDQLIDGKYCFFSTLTHAESDPTALFFAKEVFISSQITTHILASLYDLGLYIYKVKP
jgi:hypothetical protein